jgi:hypothetical protein
LRNSALNANNYFLKQQKQPRGVLWNQLASPWTIVSGPDQRNFDTPIFKKIPLAM